MGETHCALFSACWGIAFVRHQPVLCWLWVAGCTLSFEKGLCLQSSDNLQVLLTTTHTALLRPAGNAAGSCLIAVLGTCRYISFVCLYRRQMQIVLYHHMMQSFPTHKLRQSGEFCTSMFCLFLSDEVCVYMPTILLQQEIILLMCHRRRACNRV